MQPYLTDVSRFADDLFRNTSGAAGIGEFSTPDTNAYQNGIIFQNYYRINTFRPGANGAYSFTYSIGTPRNGCSGTSDPCNRGMQPGNAG
jgi:hypothetical protein